VAKLHSDKVSVGSLSLNIRDGVKLPSDSVISMSVYASTHNKHGEPAINQAGAVHMILREAIARKTVSNMPVVVYNAEKFEKGRVSFEFSVSGTTTSESTSAMPTTHFLGEMDSTSVSKLLFASEMPSDYIGSRNIQSINKTVSDYVSLVSLPFSVIKPQDEWGSMSRIHAPYYETNNMHLPGIGFCMVKPTIATSEEWYLNV
jgi:hypothetical protein